MENKTTAAKFYAGLQKVRRRSSTPTKNVRAGNDPARIIDEGETCESEKPFNALEEAAKYAYKLWGGQCEYDQWNSVAYVGYFHDEEHEDFEYVSVRDYWVEEAERWLDEEDED